jgi:hypothetical protein
VSVFTSLNLDICPVPSTEINHYPKLRKHSVFDNVSSLLNNV